MGSRVSAWATARGSVRSAAAVARVVPLLAVVALGIAASHAAPHPALAADLAALAARSGLPGDDLSPAFRIDADGALPAALRERPSGSLADVALTDPAVRVHYAPGGRDANADGVVDRAEAALRVAARTLRTCRTIGLGAPADDGDRELDLYVLGLGGAVRGYAVQERPSLDRRGATGFAVVDGSSMQDDADFEDMVARVVTRLVLGSRDASAPAFWTEPSVLAVAARATGLSPDAERAIVARWNHPERGPLAADTVLARGNLALLASLDDPALEARVLAGTWEALAARSDEPATSAIDAALRRLTGLSLLDLSVRAAVAEVTDGNGPGRWAARLQSLPALDVAPPLPVAPLGLALVRINPDPRAPEGTRVTVRPSEPGWDASLVARRRTGGWDRVAPTADTAGALSITIPWTDYDSAVLIVARPATVAGDGTFRLAAESADRVGLYALSAFGARALPGGIAEIGWSTAWEEGLFGWLVERATDIDGPWESILETPVPSIGEAHEGGAYVVQDRLRDPQVRVFYRAVVLTAEGLRVTGPAVAVRAPR